MLAQCQGCIAYRCRLAYCISGHRTLRYWGRTYICRIELLTGELSCDNGHDSFIISPYMAHQIMSPSRGKKTSNKCNQWLLYNFECHLVPQSVGCSTPKGLPSKKTPRLQRPSKPAPNLAQLHLCSPPVLGGIVRNCSQLEREESAYLANPHQYPEHL